MSNPTAPILGPDLPLNLPGGTYDATLTSYEIDAMGKEYATNMARLVPNGPFGIRLWMRTSVKSPWQLLLFKQGCHGVLWLVRGKLYFVWNQAGGRGAIRTEVLNYVHTRP